jgi:enoyl-CoA hydratase/carnithine racemase
MLAEKDGAIGWMIFDHPERRNAVTQAMWLQMGAILEDFATDAAIRIVVLKGAGDKAFVSGADISQFGQQRRNAAEVAASNRLTDAARQALATFAKPTIAMIQGFCLGGGLAIALMCDLRFASEDATFGIPAARLGVGYGAQSVGLLQALVGPAYTREILFTGRRFSGEEALRMGLINRLLPGTDLAAYVQDYAAMIGANAPLTMRAAKLASLELLKAEAARDLAEVERAVEACFNSADYHEGRTAFLEKRPPRFTGR